MVAPGGVVVPKLPPEGAVLLLGLTPPEKEVVVITGGLEPEVLLVICSVHPLRLPQDVPLLFSVMVRVLLDRLNVKASLPLSLFITLAINALVPVADAVVPLRRLVAVGEVQLPPLTMLMLEIVVELNVTSPPAIENDAAACTPATAGGGVKPYVTAAGALVR